MKTRLCIIAGVVLLMLGGCATRSTGDADMHRGYVGKVYAANEAPPDLPACLTELSPERLSGGRLVRVKYGSSRLRKYVTAFAPAEMPLAEHDRIEFGPLTCQGAEYPRITRVIRD